MRKIEAERAAVEIWVMGLRAYKRENGSIPAEAYSDIANKYLKVGGKRIMSAETLRYIVEGDSPTVPTGGESHRK